MTEHELERWTARVVAEARGRSLTPSARAEQRQIEREQPELRAEASLWAEFVELERPRPREREDADMIDDVLAAIRVAKAEPLDSAAPARPRRALVPALGILALAACVVLGVAIGELRGRSHAAIDRDEAASLGGAAMTREGPTILLATPGEHRLGEGECRRVGSSTLCTRERVRFRVGPVGQVEASQDLSQDHAELELDEGLLRVDATGESSAIEIHTPAGLVWVRGLVELRFDPATGELIVAVLDGEAELFGGHAAPLRLGVGASASLRALASEPKGLAVAREPEPNVPTPAKPATPSKPIPPASADELLAAAQQALASGETATAIDRYDALLREHPESRAARAASVSLGRLLLRAGQADEALAAFDRYLASDASELVEEAHYGRIRALRELGRTREADEAIAGFLLAHPNSIHRERLEAWKSP